MSKFLNIFILALLKLEPFQFKLFMENNLEIKSFFLYLYWLSYINNYHKDRWCDNYCCHHKMYKVFLKVFPIRLHPLLTLTYNH